MNKRVIFAGVVAGVVLFVWGFTTNVIVPLGQIGIDSLDRDTEEAVTTVLKEQIEEPGFYFMPGLDTTKTGDAANAEMDRWMKAYEAGPTGVLIYHPTGETPMSAATLGTEFANNLLVGLIAAFLVFYFRDLSFLSKVLLVASIGLIAFLKTDAGYWNWYRYPGDYTLARLADDVVSMALVGVVTALIIRDPESAKVVKDE